MILAAIKISGGFIIILNIIYINLYYFLSVKDVTINDAIYFNMAYFIVFKATILFTVIN